MSLWSFAGEVYGRPGVEDACLALQDDHGQCVSLLIWRLWLWREARAPADLAAAIALARAWEGEIVGPLRKVRRRLREGPAGIADKDRERLRAAVGRDELEAERLLLESLDRLATRPASRGTAAEIPLAEVAAAWAAGAPRALLAKLGAAC